MARRQARQQTAQDETAPDTTGQAASIDWHTVYGSEEFTRLATRRGRFVRSAAAAILGWFVVFLVVIGAAPDLAGQVLFAGMTVGLLLGLSQFVLAWIVTWRYLKLSDSVFSPLEDDVVAVATTSDAGVRP
jgi:uncharacterized membrane protein (DUF485 family)